ncbi:Stp1/IreP family PP2C-type Ser/Thr phosphatase [Microlunatus aurantiacus]|uniref:Stp1/IreP family PP2C-type Ser/Thr phosphatase n=1 Tax=Microlunatus aurantiacus TaxID=446786 RepID=A0ABP7DC93_9ACTN
MTLQLRVVSHSEVGLVRKNNQDSGYASPHLLVVADGMGGAAAGDLASAVAIDEIKRLDTPDLLATTAPAGTPDTATPSLDHDEPASRTSGDEDPVQTPGPGGSTGSESGSAGGDENTVIVPLTLVDQEPGAAGLNPLLARLAASIADANTRIADLVAADYSLEGMGTTVTGAVFDGSRLGLAHIGDSRAYLLRDGRLERLTHDHSWVQSLIDDGKISPDEAAYHPHRSLLLKVLNGQPANDPDLTTVELRAGDRLLFCSDGLCGLVDDPRIGQLLGQADLDTAVADLVDEALAAGGIDNITVIAAEAVELTSTVVPEEDDTAVRPVVGAAVVLGAAAEREIPAAPTRGSLVPGFDKVDDNLDEDPATDPDAGTTTPPPPARSTQDDESRYSPGPPVKRRLVRTLLVGLAVLLVAGAGLGAGYAWTRTQFFVGAAGDQVAIYQGLPDGIPGLRLSTVYEVQDLPVRSLPPYYQAEVTAGIEVASVEAARVTIEQLREMALRCATKPSASPTPRPTGASAGTPSSPIPRSSSTPGASGTPRTAPTPSGASSSLTSTQPTAAPRATTPSTPAPTPLPGEGC